MILFYILLINIITWLKNKTIHNLYFALIIIFIFQLSLIYKKYELENSNEFIIFHQSKKSIYGIRQGAKIFVFQKLDSLKKEIYSPLNSYELQYSNLSFRETSNPKNVLKINSKYILFLDHLGIYRGLNFKPELVIITNSPKINMERMLQNLNPKIIIADGSNYDGYVRRWEKTCKNKSINFYSTRKNGAFVYKY